MAVFQSLGALGDHLAATGMKIADPGVPLWDATAGGEFGPVWRDQPSVRKVVSFIARNIASIPLHVYDRVGDGDRRRVLDHPLSRTVAQPSSAPGKTAYRFWESILIDGLIFDRWCAMKTRRDDGSLELTRVPARRVRFEADSLDRITSVNIWTAEDGIQKFDPTKFLLDVGYSERGASGTSPMQTLRNILDESAEAVAYRRSVWKNGARVPAVIERPDPWPSNEAYERFKAGWQAFIKGGGNEGGTPILEDGMKLSQFEGFSPKDTLDLDGRRLTDIEVSSSYHIAPELVGAREGTYSNIDAFRQMLYRENLGPYIDAWVQAVQAGLLPDLAAGTDLYVEPHLEAKLRGSFEEQAKILQTATGAPWLTRDEARGRMNLPHIDGADELVVPLNVLIGGQASPRDSGTQNEGPKRGRVQVKARAPQAHVTKAAQILSDFFRRQGTSVRAKLGADALVWWDKERWDSELGGDLFALAAMTSEHVAHEVVKALGFKVSDFDQDRTLAFLSAVAGRIAEEINLSTKAEIDIALADEEPAEAVKHVFEVAETARADQSAMTTVTLVSGFAATEAARQVTDDRATKTWVTGSNPRSSHARMDGETVPVGENFSNGAPYPGDHSLKVSERANCNCEIRINPPAPEEG